jgi:hypothetical protein
MTEQRKPRRAHIAYEAARIMAEQQLSDTRAACRRAAQRLGCSNSRYWPSPDEVEDALRAQQRLFRGAAQRQALAELRAQALEAMEVFRDFRPHLIGSVLDGTADTHSSVELHLFADDPIEVATRLNELGIPWQDGEKQLRYPRGRSETRPAFGFMAGKTPLRLVVLERADLRQRPLAPGTNRPMERADRARLRNLMQGEGACES